MLEEIETHYRRSPFIKELCVLGLAATADAAGERLHAMVVPDADVLRRRRIVNIVELIRFELEGLSVSLPSHKQVIGFEVTLKPLPRSSAGTLERSEVLAMYLARNAGRRAPAPSAPIDPHVARVAALVRAHVRPGVDVCPDSNLELDLGLDSMERVELLAALEQRFGTRIPEDAAQSLFLVRDVAEALRGATELAESPVVRWGSLLELKEPTPPLRALLRRRTLTALLVFGAARVLVRTLARPRVTGLECLPRQGPFIISPNHQSYIDPLVLVGVLPFDVFKQLFFVGAAEYFETPIAAWLAARMNVIPVDPDANLLPAMQAGAYGLRHGKVLVLFPEGERSIDGSVKKFKKGAAILSQHLDVPVVPVAIAGLFEIWPRNRPLGWRRLLPWSGHRVSLAFGSPVKPPPSEVSYAEHTATLRSAVVQLLR